MDLPWQQLTEALRDNLRRGKLEKASVTRKELNQNEPIEHVVLDKAMSFLDSQGGKLLRRVLMLSKFDEGSWAIFADGHREFCPLSAFHGVVGRSSPIEARTASTSISRIRRPSSCCNPCESVFHLATMPSIGKCMRHIVSDATIVKNS